MAHKRTGTTARMMRQERADARDHKKRIEAAKRSSNHNVRVLGTYAGVMLEKRRQEDMHFSTCNGNCGRLPAICRIAAGLFYETATSA